MAEFGYVWLSVYDEAGAAKRMVAMRDLGEARFTEYRADGGGATTLGVQPPIPPDGATLASRTARATRINVGFVEGTFLAPERHLLVMSPVFASRELAQAWLDRYSDIHSAGVANRVLVTVSADSGA